MLRRRRRPDDGDRLVAAVALPPVNGRVLVATASSSEPRPSRVEDRGDGVLVVSRPVDGAGRALPAAAGERVTLSWTSELGLHEVAGVVARTAVEPLPQWVVQVRRAGAVRQRRESYRLEVRLPLTLWSGPDQRLDGAVVDLSEGGLGFEVPAGAPLARGDGVQATFPLDDRDVTVQARLVRLRETGGGARAGGARFEAMDEELATRIRRYVLQEQIRRRGKVRG